MMIRGPRMLKPAAAGWRSAVRAPRPAPESAFNPPDRIAGPETRHGLLSEAAVPQTAITPASGLQPLRSAEDERCVALESGNRWTIEQAGPETAAEARRMNLDRIRAHRIEAVETDVPFAIAESRTPGLSEGMDRLYRRPKGPAGMHVDLVGRPRTKSIGCRLPGTPRNDRCPGHYSKPQVSWDIR